MEKRALKTREILEALAVSNNKIAFCHQSTAKSAEGFLGVRLLGESNPHASEYETSGNGK